MTAALLSLRSVVKPAMGLAVLVNQLAIWMQDPLRFDIQHDHRLRLIDEQIRQLIRRHFETMQWPLENKAPARRPKHQEFLTEVRQARPCYSRERART